jgi:hypothetical protein
MARQAAEEEGVTRKRLAKAMFPMGSGPRLYTESHVAAECYQEWRPRDISSYRVSEQFFSP